MIQSLSRTSRRIAVLTLALVLFVLWSCASQRQGPELPEVSIAVVEFSQPQSTTDMFAGYMAENTPRVSEKAMAALDAAFYDVLTTETKRDFSASARFLECRDAKASGQTTGRVAALKRWVAVGNCMGVDFLLVPQILELHEREGGEAGVTRPASVVMDIFLVDVKNSVLTGRSHFDETQTALVDNLLKTRRFIARGGRWITATELAREGMVKAVRDLGL